MDRNEIEQYLIHRRDSAWKEFQETHRDASFSILRAIEDLIKCKCLSQEKTAPAEDKDSTQAFISFHDDDACLRLDTQQIKLNECQAAISNLTKRLDDAESRANGQMDDIGRLQNQLDLIRNVFRNSL